VKSDINRLICFSFILTINTSTHILACWKNLSRLILENYVGENACKDWLSGNWWSTWKKEWLQLPWALIHAVPLHIGHLVWRDDTFYTSAVPATTFCIIRWSHWNDWWSLIQSSERNLIAKGTLDHKRWACPSAAISQVFRFLRSSTEQGLKLVNNYDWDSAKFSFLNLFEMLGKHITVNYMMSKDSVIRRLEDGNGYLLQSFTYQFDSGSISTILWKNETVTVAASGSDQWGILWTGTIDSSNGLVAVQYAWQYRWYQSDGTSLAKQKVVQFGLIAEENFSLCFLSVLVKCVDENASKYIRIFSIFGSNHDPITWSSHAEAPPFENPSKELASRSLTWFHVKGILNGHKGIRNPFFGKSSPRI